MKRETYVSIPQPCHEKWDAMTPQDKGRFCAGCSKTVVDFSGMSDTQILHFLSQSKGSVCGRFAQDQIERPLIPIKKEKKKIWWMAAMLPLTLLLNRAYGQKRAVKEKVSIVKETEITMGTVALIRPDPIKDVQLPTSTIHGNVKDEYGNVLPFTNISILDNSVQTVTDEKGNFYLKIPEPTPEIKLLISNIAYEEKEITIDLKDTMNVVLQEKQAMLPEVYVTAYPGALCSYMMGGITTVASVTRRDTIATTIRKILHTNPFKVYPNPVNRGAILHVEIKQQGRYAIQLLDVNSRLITYNLLDAAKGATLTTIAIPSSVAAGMYFIRLINDDTKQQFTDKIIVQ